MIATTARRSSDDENANGEQRADLAADARAEQET